MNRIAVFCGSRPGNDARYTEAARSMGRTLVRRGIALVYGGGRRGMMRALADAVLEEGGEVIGIIPQALVDLELAHEGITRLQIVGSMHERKAAMAELADGFIGLPGGLGTLEELFEIWTWGQLGMHRKPIGLLNTEGFFDLLVAMVEFMVAKDYIQTAHREMLRVHTDPELLIDMFSRYEPPPVRQWIVPGES